MSGGVDSSVAAALLKKAGSCPEFGRRIDVIGIFMKINDFSSEAEKRARQVTKILKIPFLVLDLRKEFKKRIIDYFLEECERGVTPNPCVVCNKEIKFGLLLKKAISLDADFVATGHYARIRRGKDGIHLLRAEDKDKDQSYFLWMLNQKQLKRTLFPVGNYTRKEVERLAKKLKLPVLKAKKSVEICFIRTTVNDFLSKYLKSKPGQIVDIRGKVLGKHRGLHFYTIGQRKGIGLPGGPYYVLDKDFKNNLLVITKNERDLYKKELICKNVNWIHPVKCREVAISSKTKLFNRVKAKIRYRHQSALAIITKTLNPKTYTLKFEKSQRAITPGQSAVFYRGEELLGGGVIS